MNKRYPSQPLLAVQPTKRPYGLLASGLVIIALALFGLANRVAIRDWYILATYQPPASVKQLATDDGMTNYARLLFFVNKPAVEDKTTFAANCPSTGSTTHEIGCYHSGDNGIFLLNVTDPRLNGIVAVTAAYEMLHAGYARLSATQRSSIDKVMEQFYAQNKLSSEIKQQMASYAVSEPGARDDELYSVLGTEVGNLPAYLENHYKIYFNNRAGIVNAYNGYQGAFTSREQQILSDTAKLSSLKNQITIGESQLNSLQQNINLEQQTLSAERNSGSIAAYNSGVPGYNSLVNQYNELVYSLRAEIDQYNALVASSNALALEEQQLVAAISSSPSTQPTK